MKKCLVLGGGFAGLSSAVYLSNAGFKVELLEASPKLGGRAYSYADSETNTVIDNGQHILMGCYKETLDFFSLINALEKLEFQENLALNFINKNKEHFQLRASKLPYPVNLLTALFNFKALAFSDRIKLLKFFLKLPFYSDKEIEKMNVLEWLENENQNKNIRESFWNFLSISALNTSPEKASAKIFSDILKEIFFHGNKASTIILPRTGLSESYCTNAQKFIEDRKGQIFLSEKVEDIILENNKAAKIKTTNRETTDFDFVVSTLPLYALEKIIPGNNYFKKPDLQYSSILTIHLWLKEQSLPKTFYGLIGSPVHWVFNNGSHLTLVISDADNFIDLTKEEIYEIVCVELERYTGIIKKDISTYRVIKEKRATFIPSRELAGKKPATETKIKNLFLAGDWIETGLPSTIESAVKSGRMAAEIIKQSVKA